VLIWIVCILTREYNSYIWKFRLRKTGQRGSFVKNTSNSYLSCFTYLTAVILISLFLITANSFAAPPPGDLDGDGYVGFKDLSFLCLHWLESNEPNCPADIDGDCNVNLFDYAILAQNWLLECSAFTATASSQESSQYAPYNAIDGSTLTRWSSSFADDQWLKIDMGQIRDVNGLTIYWEAAYAKTYNIQISEDDSTWTTVYTDNNGNGGTDVISFSLQSAQYIKINCLTRVTQYGSSIWEVTVSTDDQCSKPPKLWTLVWSDEFNGTSVDTTVWNYELGNGSNGWGNSELEYYTSRTDNSYIESGSLVIQAKSESYGGKSYTSARMTTQGKKSFTYGRFEARIKLPPGGTGMWPAWWMMPENASSYGGWPACGEIDIMEAINSLPTIYGTIHYVGGAGSNGGHYTPLISPTSDYHIYAIEWGPSIGGTYYIKWYYDDINYYTSATWSTSYAPYPAPFDKPFYFILNLAVGGNWPGCTSPSCITATFPQKMYIDYLRVYQKIP
jgi:beta-glucanase (GH16 family)